MAISAGDRVPTVTFKVLTDDGLTDVASDDYLAGKKTALFAVPGAFTPTCSAKHVPSFLAQADALRAKGVDQIACVSVNDAFVMKKWGEATSVGDAIDMLADGNGEFARATGLTLDARGFGLGERTLRFLHDHRRRHGDRPQCGGEPDRDGREQRGAHALAALRLSPTTRPPANRRLPGGPGAPHCCRAAAAAMPVRPPDQSWITHRPARRTACGRSGGDIRRWR